MLVALPGSVCGETPAPARKAGVELRVELRDTVGAAIHTVSAGETIHLHLSFVNAGDQQTRLPFSSGRTHDAVVLGNDGREVWRWSDGRMFTQALTEISLAPGEEKSIDLLCDLRRVSLPPGDYSAAAVLPVLGAEIRSESVGLTVEPADD